ncbi:MAG: hypothetical protein IPK96_06885 [Flammeovirgaceae bacterium]|nr:hypothetical protein [Flammeovirgaceae bacterium]
MEYLLLGSILILVILLVLHQSNKRRTKKKIEQIRAAWGKPKTDSFDFDNIRRYSDAVKENTFHRLTDQTIEDIDLHGLFTFIDRSTSKVGQQLLFKNYWNLATLRKIRRRDLQRYLKKIKSYGKPFN